MSESLAAIETKLSQLIESLKEQKTKYDTRDANAKQRVDQESALLEVEDMLAELGNLIRTGRKIETKKTLKHGAQTNLNLVLKVVTNLKPTLEKTIKEINASLQRLATKKPSEPPKQSEQSGQNKAQPSAKPEKPILDPTVNTVNTVNKDKIINNYATSSQQKLPPNSSTNFATMEGYKNTLPASPTNNHQLKVVKIPKVADKDNLSNGERLLTPNKNNFSKNNKKKIT